MTPFLDLRQKPNSRSTALSLLFEFPRTQRLGNNPFDLAALNARQGSTPDQCRISVFNNEQNLHQRRRRQAQYSRRLLDNCAQ
jgi:hypothetical protein